MTPIDVDLAILRGEGSDLRRQAPSSGLGGEHDCVA